jgi:hypothetical protein
MPFPPLPTRVGTLAFRSCGAVIRTHHHSPHIITPSMHGKYTLTRVSFLTCYPLLDTIVDCVYSPSFGGNPAGVGSPGLASWLHFCPRYQEWRACTLYMYSSSYLKSDVSVRGFISRANCSWSQLHTNIQYTVHIQGKLQGNSSVYDKI